MKKICYMMLVVLCVLLTLSGCRGDGATKTTAVRSEMVDDITQPWALSMQYYDIYFSLEEVSLLDNNTGEMEASYYAAGTFSPDMDLTRIPILVNFNGDCLTVDGDFVAATSPTMILFDFSNGRTHEIGVSHEGEVRIYTASASCS